MTKELNATLQHDMLVCFLILTVLCCFFPTVFPFQNGLHVEALTYLGENFHFVKMTLQAHGLVDVIGDENSVR